MSRMCAPSVRPQIEPRNGALWYSGPVITTAPSSVMPSRRANGSAVVRSAGCSATISLGRPVLPPEVLTFQADAAPWSTKSSDSDGSGSNPAGSDGWPIPLAAAAPTTRLGAASSRIASRSRAGSCAESGNGVAPAFHTAIVAARNSIELGSMIATSDSGVTPAAWYARANRLDRRSSSTRVIVSVPQVTAMASGASSASRRRLPTIVSSGFVLVVTAAPPCASLRPSGAPARARRRGSRPSRRGHRRAGRGRRRA